MRKEFKLAIKSPINWLVLILMALIMISMGLNNHEAGEKQKQLQARYIEGVQHGLDYCDAEIYDNGGLVIIRKEKP